jgi:hypothetical protein
LRNRVDPISHIDQGNGVATIEEGSTKFDAEATSSTCDENAHVLMLNNQTGRPTAR